MGDLLTSLLLHMSFNNLTELTAALRSSYGQRGMHLHDMQALSMNAGDLHQAPVGEYRAR